MKRQLLSLLLITSITSSAFALPSDKTKPLTVTADHIQYNYKSNTTTYTGHVIATQGTTKLTGNKVITYQKMGKL